MTGANIKKPDISLKNRFHALQHLNAIDTVVEDIHTGNNVQNQDSCIDKPRLVMQVKIFL